MAAEYNLEEAWKQAAKETGVSEAIAEKVAKSIIEGFKNELRKGNKIHITKFGYFHLHRRKFNVPTKKDQPKPEKPVIIEKTKVMFAASDLFEKELNAK